MAVRKQPSISQSKIIEKATGVQASQYHGLPNQSDTILPQRHVSVPWTTKPVGRHTPTEARLSYHGLPNQLDAILPQRHVPVPWTTKPV
ncbi:hypothetical protein RRG08_022588 [Elysia crispata]|uniref:Uncharacterized protein n=1 Tax=Elysia crispata TaxID=231223 RepID=A0AAE1D9C1_9GAST|nr:hypothetical protein RRG08_022588 [Elysia crispata]